MGFQEVYRSLVDVFPQIDVRLLKAVAFEHASDADSAVEVVLSDVVPFLSKTPVVPVVVLDDQVEREEDTEQLTRTRRNATITGDSSSPINGNGPASAYTANDGDNGIQSMDLDLLGSDLTITPLVQDHEHVDTAKAHQHESESSSSVSVVEIGDGLSHQPNSFSPSGSDSAPLSASLNHTCTMDLLETMLQDAKQNKKSLFGAVEAVMNMMREVELEEKAAEQAKEDAASGGFDTLSKVEKLKQTLIHAKAANDMHTGEVYGEKAILATEARELQTRLLSLAEERDKSLAILHQMSQTLEARLGAAAKVREAAEQEKLEKEESARKILVEQEEIMEKVVHESKLLVQEAEANSKLQEFLMDRGRIVDSLQGEISVICEDVLLLKEKVDGHVPLGKSILSNQTNRSLASSGSSVNSLMSNVGSVQSGSMELIHDKGQSSEKALEADGWQLFNLDQGGVYSN